jgi:aspartyl-tRNA(Asn)/glutamyl-tRNA(Gln) amidotransferase subunit C
MPGQLNSSNSLGSPAQPRICYHNGLHKTAVLYFGVNVTISREDIEKVAVLARIRLDEEQIPALEKDLGNILSLVDQLSAADTDNVEPLAHPLDAVQRLRADEVTESNQREAFQAIAPAVENGLYLVPRVIE